MAYRYLIYQIARMYILVIFMDVRSVCAQTNMCTHTQLFNSYITLHAYLCVGLPICIFWRLTDRQSVFFLT